MPSNRIHVESKKRTMPVCFSREGLILLEKYAKKKGMTNYSQAIETSQHETFTINIFPGSTTRLCLEQSDHIMQPSNSSQDGQLAVKIPS
jgi:hypothetical protein